MQRVEGMIAKKSLSFISISVYVNVSCSFNW